MRDVSIVGAWSSDFGELDCSIKQLGIQALTGCIEESPIEYGDIEALFVGNFVSGILHRQNTIAPLIADSVGLSSIPALTTEGACASSGIAFRQAYHAVASGIHETVIVVGVESMTTAETGYFTRALGSAADNEIEGNLGLTFPGFYGLCMDRYMHEYGATREEIAAVSVKNRSNGVNNPRAQFRSEVTAEEVMNSRMVADPLRLLDCCPASDGSAAVILTATEHAPEYTDQPVQICGSGLRTGRNAAHRYADLTTLDATVNAAEEAYSQAGIRPSDIDVVELHDCFSIAEIGDSEDLGFFEKGEGARAAATGRTRIDGDLPINPSGGLLSKGHPVGATGIGQIIEIYLQLIGEHENQVDDAELGLAHNLGGSGAICSVTILGK